MACFSPYSAIMGCRSPSTCFAWLLFGLCIGTVTALVIGRLHVNPLIATLGMLSITGGLAFTISNGQSVSISPSLGVLW